MAVVRQDLDLRGRIQSSAPLILDGAMGTMLETRGAPDRCASNLIHPEAVAGVHRDYCAAGSHAVITNTLTMNRVFIETHKLGIDLQQVNRSGVELARRAAGPGVFVLGNLSSTGQMLEPYGELALDVAAAAFREQARCLAEAGVDGFIVETMMDLREALAALVACRAVSELPVIVCIAFDTDRDGGRTIMGNRATDCAVQLTEEGADAVGANCGSIDPEQMSRVVSTLASATRLPVAAEPNAGLPKLVGKATVFDMDPETFARGVWKCAQAGARLLGGCCGTTPAHIDALSRTLPAASEPAAQG
jgi:5-methyltetrahydrofolate--homocysteine methyltransferase